jgi:hypothetical protein
MLFEAALGTFGNGNDPARLTHQANCICLLSTAQLQRGNPPAVTEEISAWFPLSGTSGPGRIMSLSSPLFGISSIGCGNYSKFSQPPSRHAGFGSRGGPHVHGRGVCGLCGYRAARSPNIKTRVRIT